MHTIYPCQINTRKETGLHSAVVKIKGQISCYRYLLTRMGNLIGPEMIIKWQEQSAQGLVFFFFVFFFFYFFGRTNLTNRVSEVSAILSVYSLVVQFVLVLNCCCCCVVVLRSQ